MRLRKITLYLTILAVCAAALSVTWHFSFAGKDNLLKQEATSEAIRWANVVIARSPDIKAELLQGRISKRTRDTLELASKFGGVLRFKLFGPNGVIIHASRPSDLGKRNTTPYFNKLVRNGQTFAEIETEEDFGVEKSVVSEAYVPLMENGRFLGAVEVYVDVTEKTARLDRAAGFVLWSAAVLVIGMAVSWAFFIWRGFIGRDQALAKLQERDAELTDQNERFNVALDNMSQGLCMFDGEQRLIVCNTQYAAMYDLPPEIMKPGITLREILEHRIAKGIYAGENPEEYIRERQEWVTSGKWSSKIQELSDGREIAIVHQPMSGRGWLTTHEDVTGRRQVEEALMESEARLRAVFDNTPICMNLKDTEGRYLFANKRYEEWWGCSAEEVIGKTAHELQWDELGVDILTAAEQVVLETGEAYESEVRVRRPQDDGQIYDRLLIKFPVKSPNGTITGLGTVAVDITERKQAEKALQESEKHFRNLIEGSIQGVFIARDWMLLFANQALADIFGYENPEEVLALEKVAPLIAPNERDRIWNYKAAREKGEYAPEIYESRGLRKDGSIIDIEFRVKQVNWHGVAAMQCVVIDISERKRAENTLREQNTRFNAALDNMSQGLCMFDGEQRLIVANEQYATMYGLSSELVKPGTTFRQILEYRIANDIYAGEAHEDYIQERLSAVLERNPSTKIQQLKDGRFVEISHSPMSASGWLATHEDVTERIQVEEALLESEARLRAVFDNTPICINLKDTEGRYLFANKRYEEWWGCSAAEIIGKTAHEFQRDGYGVDALTAAEQVVLETGEAYESEIRVQRLQDDGQIHDRLLIKFPVKSPNGTITGLGTVAVDITERKRAEKALQESEELFAKAFHASPAACAITNPKDGTPYDVNEAWVQLLGYSREEAIGHTALELGLWADPSQRADFIGLIEKNGSVQSFEAKFRNKGGVELDFLISAEKVEVGGAPRLFIVVHDITNQLAAEKQLVEHRDLLQEKVNEATAELRIKAEELEHSLAKEKQLNELQRQFVSMASHEFRTPLTIIDTTAQRLKRRADTNRLTPEDAVQRVEKIRSAVLRMTQLMESTLTAARMQEGKIKVEIKPCDIGKIVREVCARQQEVANNHIITCHLVDLPATIQADSGSLDQVLTNLLSNAVKYAPDAPDIEVDAHREGDYVVISVRDHGLGIDEGDLRRIGERFFRARTSTGTAGTGIGLNLVKMLVEEHGGTVNVESKEGEGSTFTIRLPIAGPDLSEQADTRVA